MKEKKKSLQEVGYVLILLAAIIVLFQWYTTQNKNRMESRNKNYALDSARQIATRIDEELNNALEMISTYTYFVGKSLTEPEISPEALKQMGENTLFDALVYTDLDGVNHVSDGRISNASGRDYYLNGLKGERGISVIFDSDFYDETMLCFYAPVRYDGKVIGVLRGAYLAEEYLKDMLKTTYFGEPANVYLSMPDGTVIASSSGKEYGRKLIEELTKTGVIDGKAANGVRKIFKNGGEGAFLCSSDSETDNICSMYLPKNRYVLTQTFPKNVTQRMIHDENFVGIRLEAMLIGLFVLYIISLIVRREWARKRLEKENREMGYIIDGVNTLFTRFAMVDFETDTYQYLSGTAPKNSGMKECGNYEDLAVHLCSILVNEKDRQELAVQLEREAVIESLQDHSDERFECYVLRDGRPEWEHMNIICLERKDGSAAKVLFTR